MDAELTSRDRRRVLAKLLRELVRAETLAIEHTAREARRLGASAAPVHAMRGVADHARGLRSRLSFAIEGHGLARGRAGLTAALGTLRHLMSDRVLDPERAYRGALHDLHHGLDLARALREVARAEGVFALVRWCDDFLAHRPALLAAMDAELEWFVRFVPAPAAPEPPPASPPHDDGEALP